MLASLDAVTTRWSQRSSSEILQDGMLPLNSEAGFKDEPTSWTRPVRTADLHILTWADQENTFAMCVSLLSAFGEHAAHQTRVVTLWAWKGCLSRSWLLDAVAPACAYIDCIAPSFGGALAATCIHLVGALLLAS